MAIRRSIVLGTVFTTVLTLALPFVGGAGPSLSHSAQASSVAPTGALLASSVAARPAAADPIAAASAVATDWTSVVEVEPPAPAVEMTAEHVAQKPVPPPPPPPPVSAASRASGTVERRAAMQAQGLSCPGNVGGGTPGAPGATSPLGVAGTTSGDLASFASAYNAIRVANCLHPVPMSNFRYDSCMEQRLFWMAEDPSTDPSSAWGHTGSAVRSDGAPIVGCDGNLAGGSGNTGATVAQKWWNSAGHRNSLYRPSHTGGTGGVCIYFAMTHGGVPNEPYGFTRAAARWGGC